MAGNDKAREYWQERVKSAELRSNLNDSIKAALQEIMDLNIGDICDDAIAGVEQADQKKAAEFASALAKALIINTTPIVRSHIEEKNMAINERLGADALDAWRTVVSQPIELPKETVESIVQQPAVKELFVNVIHDAIIDFNKKFNPLFGAVAALGIDKQIKEFLVPFMDSATDLVTNFLTDNKNNDMFSDFSAKIFDIAIAEKPAKYMGMPIEESSEKIADAVYATINDEKGQADAKTSSIELIKKIKDKFGSQSIRDYMKDNSIPDPTRDLTDWELDMLVKHMSGTSFTDFISTELAAFSDS